MIGLFQIILIYNRPILPSFEDYSLLEETHTVIKSPDNSLIRIKCEINNFNKP